MGSSLPSSKKNSTTSLPFEGSSELIDVAKSNVGPSVKFIHSTFEDVELNERYDNIFLIHTLEHIDDRVGVLKRIKSWLSDDGRLFLAVPNANAASRQLAVKMGFMSHNADVTEAEELHGHRITYTSDVLEKEVQESGLQIHHRAGVVFKPLANFQYGLGLKHGVIDLEYIKACFELGQKYPDLCASIAFVCGR